MAGISALNMALVDRKSILGKHASIIITKLLFVKYDPAYPALIAHD